MRRTNKKQKSLPPKKIQFLFINFDASYYKLFFCLPSDFGIERQTAPGILGVVKQEKKTPKPTTALKSIYTFGKVLE